MTSARCPDLPRRAASDADPIAPMKTTTVLVNIDVPDLAAGERFYTAAFGLKPARRFGAEALELSGWPQFVYLLLKPPDSLAARCETRRYRRHWTPIHLDMVVSDVDAAVDRAIRAGALLEHPAREAGYGRIAMLADPFGHGFCLIEFSAAGYDAVITDATTSSGTVQSEDT
ncbi:MAG TPA: VOC family protein [Stellaceae bacterium]|nr:VOC family protein [Stellaceae bacterium]